jgi:hypothetical protein
MDVNRVVVTLDDKEVWSTELNIEESESTASTTSDPPPTAPSPVSSASSLCPIDDYPDSTPDFDESTSLQAQAEADEVKFADAIKVEVSKLHQVPPCPPHLRPLTLPVTHPLSQVQQQFKHEQLMLEQQQQQQLRRMRQINTAEKEGHLIPTDTMPVVIRSNHNPSPYVLVPATHICKHCGAVNLLVKDQSLHQSDTPK